MPRPRKLSREILEAALHGLEAQRQRLDSQIADVRQMLGTRLTEPTAAAPKSPRPSYKRSGAVRRKMAEAQRRRWAALREARHAPATAKSVIVPETPKRKRRLSAAGRKAIVEATKRRWAEFRKQSQRKPVVAREAARKKVAAKAVKKATAKKPKTAVPAPE
jgi:hypothetical protein